MTPAREPARRRAPGPRPPGRVASGRRIERIAAAAQTACLLEIAAPKPGNVSRGRDLPGLTYRDLALSACAIGPAFSRHAGGRVGRLVLEAVRATRRFVRTNTNLGIVLLLAPLARAALAEEGRFRDRLRRVLDGLDVRDARDAYAAIRLARPGGLGRASRQDVRRPPSATLLECMRLAASRDAIAGEYATGFRTTLQVSLPALRRLRERRVPLPPAIVQTALAILAAAPDTHLARRHGDAAARRVTAEARRALEAGGMFTERGRRRVTDLDRRLRTARPPLNPGATADLTVAALFLWLLEAGVSPMRSPRRGSSRARRTPRRRGPPSGTRR